VSAQFVEGEFIAERCHDLVLIAATEPTLDVVVYGRVAAFIRVG
jgi:hypothetical protein